MSLTVKAIRTGRRWGDKIAETEQVIKVDGARVRVRSFDAWDGGSTAGEPGEYVRHTVLEAVENVDWRSRHDMG